MAAPAALAAELEQAKADAERTQEENASSAAANAARLSEERERTAQELREQLDHVRSLSLTRGESTWLRGNTFYGKRWMFTPDFMQWLEGFRFPDYHLERRGDHDDLDDRAGGAGGGDSVRPGVAHEPRWPAHRGLLVICGAPHQRVDARIGEPTQQKPD